MTDTKTKYVYQFCKDQIQYWYRDCEAHTTHSYLTLQRIAYSVVIFYKTSARWGIWKPDLCRLHKGSYLYDFLKLRLLLRLSKVHGQFGEAYGLCLGMSKMKSWVNQAKNLLSMKLKMLKCLLPALPNTYLQRTTHHTSLICTMGEEEENTE